MRRTSVPCQGLSDSCAKVPTSCRASDRRARRYRLTALRLTRSSAFHLHEGAVEVAAPAQVGDAVGRERVRRRARRRLRRPPSGRHRHDAGTDLVADLGRQFDRAAIVEHAHRVAVADPPLRGVVGVQVERRRLLGLQRAIDVAVARVQEVVRALRGQQRERVAGRERGIAGRTLRRGREPGQRIHAHAREPLRVQLALARRREEPAVGVRQDLVLGVDADPPALAELTRSVLAERGQGRRDHLLVRRAERRILEAHPRRQPPEDLGVRQRVADGRDRRLVDRQVRLSPRPMHVVVLDLRRGRQDVVGVERGVGQHVLEHHREQVLAAQTLQHQVLVRRDRRRVRVVDDQRTDRRIHRRVGQRAADLDHVDRTDGSVLGHGDAARPVDVPEELERHVTQTAAAVAPRSDDGGQAADRAERRRPVRVVLHPHEQADRGGARGRVRAREVDGSGPRRSR